MEQVILVVGLVAVAYGVYYFWQKKGDDVKDAVENVKDKFDK